MHNLTYVFFGTPRFAEIILERLIAHKLPPSLIVTNPDRPAGRKKILTASPVKLLAERSGIKVLQPESLKDFVLPFEPTISVVAAYSKILPLNIIEYPKLGTIGVHPSLLPKYRGASPIQSALLAGETETGTTLYQMDAAVDHGPILAIKHMPLEPGDTYTTTLEKLGSLSGDLLAETLPKFAAGKITPVEQIHAQATKTKKFTSEDAFVDLKSLQEAKTSGGAIAKEIFNKIRALNPEPGVWTEKDGKRIKLLEAKLENDRLLLTKTQEEGKKPILLTTEIDML